MNGFYELTPDLVLESVESSGFEPTGQLLQLNSYENRVFDIQLEDKSRLVAKFYRPNRWSKEAILEEHQFLKELSDQGISVVSPLPLPNKSTVNQTPTGIYWSVFPKIKGRMPDELLDNDFVRVGRLLARIHNVGSQKKAIHRPTLDIESYALPALEILETWLPPELISRYMECADELIDVLSERLSDVDYLRIHGDAHRGNLLNCPVTSTESEYFFVDFDDFCNGPAAQDFWMLIGNSENSEELDLILKGYEELRSFNVRELELFEPLRGLRLIHYSSWIAKRWNDPSFPKLFPEFNTYNYWSEETEAIEKILWNL